MPREKECFRDNLEILNEKFKEPFISMSQAAKYLHIDARTLHADKTFPIKKIGNRYKVPVVQLARWLS